MARLSSELILSLTDHVSGPARRVGSSLDDVSRRANTMGSGLGRTSGPTTRAASALGMYATSAAAAAAPLAAGFAATEVLTQAADFESALTEIQKKAGTTAEETRALGDEIKALATSGKVAVPLEEIAAAYERGAAAGIPIAQLSEFAEQSAKAADAFGMTAESVGNFTAKLKTGLRMSSGEVRDVLDLTNSLADAGIADESAIVDYVDRVGASLKTLGMNSRQSLALGATMLNLGMTAEVAATGTDALATKLLGVARLTGTKRQTFEKYMGSVEQFGDSVAKDANGALLTMLERIKELKSTERMEFLTEFVGQDHASKILRVAEAIDELRRNNALANDKAQWTGSLGKSYDLKLDDMNSKWIVFRQNLKKLSIDLGSLVLPPAAGFLDEATQEVQRFADFVKGAKTVASTLANAATGSADRVPGDFDKKGMRDDWAWPFNPGRVEADAIAARTRQALAAKDPKSGAVGAMAARDMDGVTAANLLAAARNHVRRSAADTPTEKREIDYRTTRVLGSRSAEAESMLALKREYGGYLNSDGQSFRKGTDARDLVDDALAQFAGAVLTSISTMNEAASKASGAALKTGDLGTSTGALPVPTPRPDLVGPMQKEADAAKAIADQAGAAITTALSVTGTPKVDTSGLVAARMEAERLRQTLERIPGLAAQAQQAARDSAHSARVDFDGLYADMTN